MADPEELPVETVPKGADREPAKPVDKAPDTPTSLDGDPPAPKTLHGRR